MTLIATGGAVALEASRFEDLFIHQSVVDDGFRLRGLWGSSGNSGCSHALCAMVVAARETRGRADRDKSERDEK